MYTIIWPESRSLTPDEVMQLAHDDWENDLTDFPEPVTVEDALTILQDTGTVTFADDCKSTNGVTAYDDLGYVYDSDVDERYYEFN